MPKPFGGGGEGEGRGGVVVVIEERSIKFEEEELSSRWWKRKLFEERLPGNAEY